MMKLVVFVFLVALAVASAQLLAYPGVVSTGAYGAHPGLAISSSARAQISRSPAIIAGIAPAPYILG